MKNKTLLTFSSRFATHALVLGFGLLAWSSFAAQNLVKNGDFEEPLGPDNWTIVYTGVSNATTVGWPYQCSRSDFYIAGRTRLAHKDLVPGTWDGEDGTGTNYWSEFGLHFCASHDWLMHAYASQVVTGLTAFASYDVSAWITQFDFNAVVDKVQVYMEILGGASGTTSKKTPYVTTVVLGSPQNWTRYVLSIQASASGQIEIRLHYNKNSATNDEKWRNLDALFDHVVLVPTGETLDMPPFKIDSFALANQTVVTTFGTVSNDIYRVLSGVHLAPNVFYDDLALTWVTNSSISNWLNPKFLIATENSMTVTNNAAAASQQFFRVERLWPYP